MDWNKVEELLETRLIDAHDNYKCLCPFHDEKTPSFFIHKTDFMAHCFGCGRAGYIDMLVASKRGIPTSKARELLDLSPLDIGFKQGYREYKEPEEFPESWLAAWPRISNHTLLNMKGIKQETTIWAEARWDHNTSRIVFPHRYNGKLVGAAGRAVDRSDPKWYFYWNYKKSKHLYYPNKVVIDKLLIVEGIFDALYAIQSRVPAAAILGSKPSQAQVKQIKSITNHVIIGLDNDEAGRIGGKMLEDTLKNSVKVEYASIPEFANDVCDLSYDQLIEAYEAPMSPLEKKLYVGTE